MSDITQKDPSKLYKVETSDHEKLRNYLRNVEESEELDEILGHLNSRIKELRDELNTVSATHDILEEVNKLEELVDEVYKQYNLKTSMDA